MSYGVKGAAPTGGRVSDSSGVKKMIENIKEITGQNHSENEIYATLKECSMDPNEALQKLLLFDTFHEVKSKRDRRKENLNKEATESKWKPGTQARVNRAGLGSYSSRYISHDAGGGRNSSALKENAIISPLEKSTGKAHFAAGQEMKKNATSLVSSLGAPMSNGPSGTTSQSSNIIYNKHTSATGIVNHQKATGDSSMTNFEGLLPLPSPVDSTPNSNVLGTADIQKHQKLDSSNSSIPARSAPASASYFSSSDPILLPSQNSPLLSAVGTIWRAVGSQHTPAELSADIPTESISSSARISYPEVGSSHLQQKMPNDLQGAGKNQHLEPLLPASSTIGVSTISRPSSNQNNRSQAVGPQKVGPGKEWKPKSASSIVGQGTTPSYEVPAVPDVSHPDSQPTTDVLTLKEDIGELQTKLENSHISDTPHVIIPDHLHVPEVEKLGFCFGSFDATFGLEISHNDGTGSGKSPPFSEPKASAKPVKELQLSNQKAFVAAEDADVNFPDQPQSPSQGPENFPSSEVEVSGSITPDYSDSKQEVVSGTHQHDVIPASSNYNFGFMQPVANGQLTPLDTSESQVRDAHQLPGFFVHPSFDPASYYAQLYRSGIENDGRISPFHIGAANKYNGDATMVSPTNSQSQELHGGIPHIASPPLVTQAAGVMQSSVPGQQPLPVFRQPTGLHLPHYPPNYIPYGHYFPPFYVPPPAFHQFISNGAFPQQPQAANLYPTTPGTATKYPVSQYKEGSITGNPTHVGLPGNYSPYGLSVANYTSSSATGAVTSASNEDIVAPQVKQNNIYLNGQQSEGTGVWFANSGRDISAMQAASSFYNLPQGQLAFTPTQPGQGAFAGIFHPAQAAAAVHPLLQQSQPITSPADMVGPTPNVYQTQPQHAQLNWPSNY